MYKIIGADQVEYGPITAEQVRQWVAEGRLNGLSKIQVDGSGQWKQLREMPEFASLLPPLPPPITLPAASPPSSAGVPPNNPLAAWSLGTGIASLACCPGFILSLISIVLGPWLFPKSTEIPIKADGGWPPPELCWAAFPWSWRSCFWAIALLSPESPFRNGFPR